MRIIAANCGPRVRILGAEGQRELARRRAELTPEEWRACPERAALIESCYPMAMSIAGPLCRSALGEDALGLACLGLVRAADAWDPDRGVNFSTYATAAIRSAIFVGAPSVTDLVRIPAWLCDTMRREAKGRPIDPEAQGLANYRELAAQAESVRSVVSLAATGGHGFRGDFSDAVIGREEDPADGAHAAELRTTLERALARIHPRQAEAVRLRFLSGGDPPPSYREVGPALGVTAERARQLVTRGLRALARQLDPAATRPRRRAAS